MFLLQDRDQWRDFVNTVMILCYVEGEEFINQLNYSQVLKEHSAPWASFTVFIDYV